MNARSVAATAVLWAAFVVALQVDGAWQLLGADVLALSAFACAVALLAYGVDAEARRALECLPPRALVGAALLSIAVAAAAPRAVGLLVVLPGLAVAAVALARRALGLHVARAG